MKVDKDKVLSKLHKELKDKGMPTLDNRIYLSENLYLLENGDIIEIE